MNILRTYFKAALLTALLTAGCSHTQQPVTRTAPMVVPARSPKWVSEDCVKRGDAYTFVGYGEGTTSVGAIQSALLSSRQNALACIFGGEIKAKISIKEDNTDARYNSESEVTLDYRHVNWTGYELVPGRVFHADKSQTKIYAQYRWSDDSITKERARLADLSQHIAQVAAMKEEVELKSTLISEQKAQLEQLQKQDEELAAITSASAKAVAQLAAMRRRHEQNSGNVKQVIKSLYCGITVGELIRVFREPNSYEFEPLGTSNLILNLKVFWDQYFISFSNSELEKMAGRDLRLGDDNDSIVRIVQDARIKSFGTNFGLTYETINVCGS